MLAAQVLCLCLWAAAAAAEETFDLTILHLNDFHARYEQTTVITGKCPKEEEAKNRCYGGFARIKTAVDQERAKSPNVLYLSAGDSFQGTIWYSEFKWRAMAHFLNLVPHDAMSLGNHEFDDGLPGIVPFLENVSFPVLAANLNDTLEPSIQGKYKRSTIVTLSGRRVGIVGYLTVATQMISNPGLIDIHDEVVAVRKEARRLRQEEGVDIIIALGHAGFAKDLEIARDVEEVDVVVGGHTNTFLYTGKNPSTEEKKGEYPWVVTQASGRRVPVVQAYAFGKYLGRLVVSFDESGEAVSWSGNPLLLDNSVPQDEGILKELEPFRKEMEEKMKNPIARTFVFLDGSRKSCRLGECNLGNLLTDAIVHENAKYPDDRKWALTSLAVHHGGGIRSSVSQLGDKGSITVEDVLAFAPFQNTIDIVELRGVHVKEMFEFSAHRLDRTGILRPAEFLQVSGFMVVYDLNLPPGSRVVRLQARCLECVVPGLEDVKDDEVYRVAMPSFLANGGDGYTVIRDNKINHHLTGLLDSDVYVNYLSQMSPIYQGTENRILFIDSEELCVGEGNLLPSTTSYTTSHITKDGGGAAGATRGSLTLVAAWVVLVVVAGAVRGTAL
ncbi:snake venom 5'-nucleotidase-like [Eriocheir sinensis]|uniref:snake venom 5'-nucleotidase-like n=1 Tax=Eriocheir sinensis TaxID=95602 RepID=UPI0021C9BC0A|nr:snake venom 5'-nucleotidase-like [Eriocheir sinensis]